MKKIITRSLAKLVFLFNCVIPKKKNGVIFYSFPDYSDSCRAIFEKMAELNLEKLYDITWVVNDINKYRKLFPNVRFVKQKSVFSMYHMCRSRYIIRSHSFWGNRYVKNKQIMCIAWHGMHIKGFTSAAYGKPKNSFDHFCVTSPAFAEIYSKAWNADLDRFDITGLPRNDYMFASAENLIRKLGLDCYKKLIIWMPTFRGSTVGGRGVEGIQSEFGIPTLTRNDLPILNEKLKEKECCMLFKLHPWAVDNIGDMAFSNIRVINNSDIPEPFSLYHLIGQMDAMISDYSSVWVDYLLLDRPIGFAFNDLEDYKKSRTMVFEPIEDYMPGMKIKGIEGVIGFIDSLFMDDLYAEERKRIRDLFITHQDSSNTERYLKAIGLLE